jgi:hypothetical protein
MSDIKYHAPWHTLKKVCVGSSYSEAFYEPIRNSKIKESLQKIARETEEDFANLVSVLESFDVGVSRPTIDKNQTIMDFVDHSGIINYKKSHSFTLIPRPPMQPRDSFLVIGDIILATNSDAKKIVVETLGYQPDNLVVPWERADQYYLPKHLVFDAPLATVVGDTVILDCRDHDWLYGYFVKAFPNYKIKPVYIGGHNDAVYSVVKPGLLISTYHYDNYVDTFPGWTVKFIENQSWNAIPEWRKIKHSNIDRWWVPDEINNRDFSTFIDAWLSNWTGFVKETVFDVNLLQINDRTVLVNNYNKDMFEFLKKHNIDAIVASFRHRFFWDGGLHCITNDYYREGKNDSYVN